MDMLNKINCEYCNKIICKSKLNRHQNSKECKNKQLNKDVIIPIKEYKCKYCNKKINRLDKQKEHELICDAKELYYKFKNYKDLKEKELVQKDKEINIYKEENIFLKSQLQMYRPINNTNCNNTTNNIIINNTININFGDIQKHLNNFNIHVLSDQSSLINFIMPIFEKKVKLINECKQIMTYYLNDKLINDIKCKIFICNSANELIDISNKICIEGKNNKLISDTIVKNACINNKILNEISTEEGIKNGIRKKNKHSAMILVHEIIKYLKENEMTDIKGV